MSDDGRATAEEKSSASGKLESMPKEGLIKLVQSQILLKKKLDARIGELTTSNSSLCQSVEELQNQLDQEQETSKILRIELEQSKTNENKLQQELSTTRESIDCFRLQNETLKFSCQNLQSEISSLQSELSKVRASLNHVEEDFTAKMNEAQNTIENLFNEKQCFEEEKHQWQESMTNLQKLNDELRLQLSNVNEEKTTLEENIAQLRQQIEALRLEQCQSISPIQTSSPIDSIGEISEQCLNAILSQIDREDQQISKIFSDSNGISLSITETFTQPFNLEDLHRFCKILIEQLSSNPSEQRSSTDSKPILITQTDGYEEYRMEMPSSLSPSFDRIVEELCSTRKTENIEIVLSKPIDTFSPSMINHRYTRLSLNEVKLISDQIEEDLQRLAQQNANQHEEILRLRASLDRMAELERNLQEEQTKNSSIELFSSLQQSHDDLQRSYRDLEEKYRSMEQIQNEFDHQKETVCSLQSEIDRLTNESRHQAEQFSSILKREQQLSDLLETKINEVKQFTERVQNLEDDLREYRDLVFEKTKQADDLDRQLQLITHRYEELKAENDDKSQFIAQIQKLEEEKNQMNQMIETLKNDIEQMSNDASQVVSLRSELEMRTDELNNERRKFVEFEQNEKEIRSELEKQKEENENLHRTTNDLKEKLQKESEESNATIQDLKEKQQKMKLLLTRLKKELDEKSQQPKQSHIELEIADYEKTIKNLKETIVTKEKEIEEYRTELNHSTERIAALTSEISNLTEEKSQNDERAKKFQNLYEITRKELQDAKDLEHERHQNEDNIRQLIHRFQTDLDNDKVLISQLTAEKQQLIDRLNQQTEISQRTIQLLEQNLRINQHDLEIAKKDYEALQEDFQSYKIRAQSVLKQHQSAPREPAPSMITKNVELEETIEKLQVALDDANQRIQSLIIENEELKREQERLIDLQTKLSNEWKKREADLRKRHQLELQTVENDCQQRLQQSQDLLTNVHLQNETLCKSLRDQIAAMQEDHERTISMLQNQLQNAKAEIEKWKLLRTTAVTQDNDKESNHNEPIRDDPPWIYAERQQGEGSESASTDPQSTHIATKTLENVLFGNSGHSRSSSSLMGDRPRHVLFEDPEIERQRLEDELNKTKVRLSNTTELLNESELNNVRLGEQVTVLKDEIRRLERSIERNESISNLEYLKNIILKFFFLKSSPERLQLVPVLVTMLKLSPDEQGQLIRVAQHPTSIDSSSVHSESNPQSVTTSANPNSSGSSTWSSYLNFW